MKRTRKVQLISSLRMSIAEWRASTDLVATARETLNQPALQHMLDVLRMASPGLGTLPDPRSSPDIRAHCGMENA
jgi:hypothetical protein